MRVRSLIAGLFLLVGVGADISPTFALDTSLQPLLPGNPLEGSRFFTGKGCLNCHAIHGVGGTSGPDLGRGILNRPLLEIAGVMWNHSPGMEHLFQEKRLPRPLFEPAEMASLLAFLYYLSSFDPPGDAAAGSRLFREKGCQACHAVGGKGGHVGPELDKYSRYASPLYVTTALWDRGRAMAEKMRELGVPRPTFEGRDIPDLLAYIQSAGGGTERVYAPPGSAKRGEALFTEKRCIECHSVRGHGGNVGPDLGIRLRGSLMGIAGAMWNHGPHMWAKMAERGIRVPTLTVAEMSDLTSFLYFFQFIDPPGDAARGRAVYREKRCGTCHGSVAPPLVGVVGSLAGPLDIITAMWNHAGKMEMRMAEVNVPWPVLKGGEMADLVAYLLSLRAGGPQPIKRPEGPKPKGEGR